MNETRVILTAGHGRSVPAEALAELLRRDGIKVAGIIVVSMLNTRRFLALIRQRGLTAVMNTTVAALGWESRNFAPDKGHGPSKMTTFLTKHNIRTRGLKAWCDAYGAQYWRVDDLNACKTVAIVKRAAPHAVLYAGGGILRRDFIAAAGRVLNAHAGPLPEIRGMNAAEWAALLDMPAEVTIHFIDTGIDTGKPIRTFAYDRSTCKTTSELRQAATIRGVEGMHEVVRARAFEASTTSGPAAIPSRQCFIMAPALVQMLERRLSLGTRSVDE